MKLGFGGSGYLAPISGLGAGFAESVSSNRLLLPEGDPGVVIVTLGGNDAAQKRSAAEVASAEEQLIGLLRQSYPNAAIVVDGVMSRNDAAHAARRAMDATVTEEAQRIGVHAIFVPRWGDGFAAARFPGHRKAVMHRIQATLEASRDLHQPFAAEPELQIDRQAVP